MFKKSQSVPILHFSALCDLPETFEKIFSFLRAFVVSRCRKSGFRFRVFLSLRYGADLGRSKFQFHIQVYNWRYSGLPSHRPLQHPLGILSYPPSSTCCYSSIHHSSFVDVHFFLQFPSCYLELLVFHSCFFFCSGFKPTYYTKPSP